MKTGIIKRQKNMFVKCKTLLTPKSIEGLGEKVQEIFQDLRMENRRQRSVDL